MKRGSTIVGRPIAGRCGLEPKATEIEAMQPAPITTYTQVEAWMIQHTLTLPLSSRETLGNGK